MMSLFGLNHTSSGGLFTCEQIRHFWIRSPCDYRLITSHKHTWCWNWKHFLISGCTRQSLALLHSSYLLFFARSPIVGSEKQENYFPSPIKVARVSLKRQKIHENRKKSPGEKRFSRGYFYSICTWTERGSVRTRKNVRHEALLSTPPFNLHRKISLASYFSVFFLCSFEAESGDLKQDCLLLVCLFPSVIN